MPPFKIQPIDSRLVEESIRSDPVKPIVKSRLKRLFERQFPSVLRISSTEKPSAGEQQYSKDANNNDWEPSSVCLDKMVRNFIEENNEKYLSAAKCGRNRCNCFNGSCSDSSDDEFDVSNVFTESKTAASCGDACEILKSLVPCASVAERNLLADTAKVIEKNKGCKGKDDCRKVVTDGLVALGYDASICKSRWEKSPSFPAGEYEYVDVIVDGERLLIDVDFRSEFEIARSTGTYKAVLQVIPTIFVGKADRLQQIISIISDAARQSLKKKGMHFPPWRKAEYMKAKWLSPYTRATSTNTSSPVKTAESRTQSQSVMESEKKLSSGNITNNSNSSGEFELLFGENSPRETVSGASSFSALEIPEEEDKVKFSPWKLPAIKPKSSQGGARVVTGLASVLKEKS